METQIDLLPVSSLPDRYRIGKPAVYGRMEKLGITPQKIGRLAYITADELKKLDNLHDHLQSGRSFNEFIEQNGISSNGHSLASLSSMNNLPMAMMETMPALIGAILERVQPPAPIDPLARLRGLQEAYEQGWHLTSKELAGVLGCAPQTITRHSQIERGGFLINRVGKQAGEITWQVNKPSKKKSK